MARAKMYRFRYYYDRHGQRQMAIHFRRKIYVVDSITCATLCKSKFSIRQPRVVMEGRAYNVCITTYRGETRAYIS